MATGKSISDYYRDAVPLPEAMFRFAPEKLAKAYRWAVKRDLARNAAAVLEQIVVLKSPSVHESTRQSIAGNLGIDMRHPPDDEFCRRDPKKFQRVRQSLQHHSEHGKKLFSTLRAAMREGKFVGIAYEMPRTSKSELAVIPRDVLESHNEIDLADSYLAGNGLEFIAVRLLPAEAFDSEGFIAKRGPRSRKPEIISTYDALLTAGTISPNDKPKVVREKIRIALIESTGKRWGLSDDTIWRAVEPLHTERQKGKFQGK